LFFRQLDPNPRRCKKSVVETNALKLGRKSNSGLFDFLQKPLEAKQMGPTTVGPVVVRRFSDTIIGSVTTTKQKNSLYNIGEAKYRKSIASSSGVPSRTNDKDSKL
jgi:hypothetical protein